MFGNVAYTLIPNAIDISRFLYNPVIKKKKRNELGIKKNEFVIGHVGRLSYQKNHKLLIRILAEFLKQYNDAVLILVGVGEKEGRNQKTGC